MGHNEGQEEDIGELFKGLINPDSNQCLKLLLGFQRDIDYT